MVKGREGHGGRFVSLREGGREGGKDGYTDEGREERDGGEGGREGGREGKWTDQQMRKGKEGTRKGGREGKEKRWKGKSSGANEKHLHFEEISPGAIHTMCKQKV